MLKKLFQQLIRFFARLFSSHSKPFEFPKGSKKPPIRPIIFVPGSSASIQRFNGTIRMLHRFSRKKQSLLKIKVKSFFIRKFIFYCFFYTHTLPTNGIILLNISVLICLHKDNQLNPNFKLLYFLNNSNLKNKNSLNIILSQLSITI